MTLINYDIGLCLVMNAGDITSLLTEKHNGTPPKRHPSSCFPGRMPLGF
jgi:hypothetical protein